MLPYVARAREPPTNDQRVASSFWPPPTHWWMLPYRQSALASAWGPRTPLTPCKTRRTSLLYKWRCCEFENPTGGGRNGYPPWWCDGSPPNSSLSKVRFNPNEPNLWLLASSSISKASPPHVGVEVSLEALLWLRKNLWVSMSHPLWASDGALIFCFFVRQNRKGHPHLRPFGKRRLIIRWFFWFLFGWKCLLPLLGVQKIYTPLPHMVVCSNSPRRC
jgi:hypothetical protein